MLPESLKLLRKFSKVALTGRDFMKLCRLNKISVIFSDECSRGMYYFADGRHFIALSTQLSAEERAFVAWHEFAHFLQNFNRQKPIAAFSDVHKDAPGERMANTFACIALHPENIRITGPMDFIKMIMRTSL
jgi:Zn-dependent peptidase ImmA (M78 family)